MAELILVDANECGDGRISAPASAVSVLAIPTDEERTIARQTMAVLRTEGALPLAAGASASHAAYSESQA